MSRKRIKIVWNQDCRFRPHRTRQWVSWVLRKRGFSAQEVGLVMKVSPSQVRRMTRAYEEREGEGAPYQG